MDASDSMKGHLRYKQTLHTLAIGKEIITDLH